MKKVLTIALAMMAGLSSCQKSPAVINVTGISLDKTSVTLTEGESAILTPVITPSDASDKTVKWSSDNNTVADVEDGVVSALASGQAIVTATTVDGGKAAKCTLTVEKAKYYPGTNLEGIKIGNVTWAPVNCGYDQTNYPYGKMYQFGRAVGGGYNDGDNFKEEIIQTEKNAIYTNKINSYLNSDVFNTYFFIGNTTISDWYASEESATLPKWPIVSTGKGYLKGKVANPCPAGWRVPDNEELASLLDNKSVSMTKFIDYNGQKGHWFNGSDTPDKLKAGSTTEYEGVFFPAAGKRLSGCLLRGAQGYYWSSAKYYEMAQALVFTDDIAAAGVHCSRHEAYAVRCVRVN